MHLVLRLEPPYTGVPRPSGPEIPKKSQKGVPGPLGLECRKSVEKVPNDSKRGQKDYKISVRGLFRHFFDTPGREAREDLFETFWGFRGSGVWRLLYMGIAIVNLVCTLLIHFLAGKSCVASGTAKHRSPEALWLRHCQKSLKKVFPGIPAGSAKKIVEKSPKGPEKKSKSCQNQFLESPNLLK